MNYVQIKEFPNILVFGYEDRSERFMIQEVS